MGPVVNSDVESTSAVATVVRRAHVWTEIGPNKFENKLSDLKVGTKVLVDRLEYNRLSENSPQDEDTGMNFRYYHIKGTKNWISEEDVKVNKKYRFITIIRSIILTSHSLKTPTSTMQMEQSKIIMDKR